jgi:membrane associated rhomboid family serine protease
MSHDELSDRPAREKAINLPAIIILLIVSMAAMHVLRLHGLDLRQDIYLTAYAAFIPAAYSGSEELRGLPGYLLATSPFTYAFLHGSWTHLAMNSLWLAVFGAPLAARIGAVRFAAFFLLTAALAAFSHLALHWQSLSPLIGASGAVSACTAAAARFAFRVRGGTSGFAGRPLSLAETFTNRSSLTFIMVWFAINLISGVVAPDAFGADGASIAWQAHVGGFAAGLLLLPLFDRKPA